MRASRAVFAAILLTATAATNDSLSAQEAGQTSARLGAGFGHGANTVRVDVDHAAYDGLSLILSGRHVSSAFACDTFIGGLTPCTPDGLGLAAGIRILLGHGELRPFLEVTGGGHRYDNAQLHTVIGGQAGLHWAFGSRGLAQLSYELYRIGAEWIVPGSNAPINPAPHHLGGGVSVALGMRFG